MVQLEANSDRVGVSDGDLILVPILITIWMRVMRCMILIYYHYVYKLSMRGQTVYLLLTLVYSTFTLPESVINNNGHNLHLYDSLCLLH